MYLGNASELDQRLGRPVRNQRIHVLQMCQKLLEMRKSPGGDQSSQAVAAAAVIESAAGERKGLSDEFF